MFKQFASIGTTFENYMTRRGRVEAHKILMAQDDKTLEDIGIDRHELQGGVKNWPWDGSVTLEKVVPVAKAPVAKARAIRELNNYSDRELHDIGINRGMIADAVANGRAGIDNVVTPERPVTGDDRQAA